MKPSMPTIPDFTTPGWQEERSTPQLAVSILDGKGALMPAFRGRVSDDQAQDLVAYLRAFGPTPPKTPVFPSSDFEKRFLELQEQWKELQKQLEELSPKAPKP